MSSQFDSSPISRDFLINTLVLRWIPVKCYRYIPHNLETTPLKIKTDSSEGSDHYVYLRFYSGEREYAGTFYFNFWSPMQYKLYSCQSSRTIFPTAPPSDVNKIWTITKLPGPRLTVQCNHVLVLDTFLSNDTCEYTYW